MCGILIMDDTETCPLCHTVLDCQKKDWENLNEYPDIPVKRRRFSRILKAALFLCVLTTILCVFINYKTGVKFPWSSIVGVALFYGYYLFYLMSDKYAGYMKRIVFAIFWAVAATIVLDIIFGFRKWSFNFVLPGGIILFNIAIIILMIVNRRNWQSYIMSMVISIVLAIIPLGFARIGLISFPTVSELAFISCLAVFLGTIIFGGRAANSELKRRFHF